LKRGEILDQMALSMPVATVIGDNTGASLKALELTMKAGERVHKAAELLVSMHKANDTNALRALQLQLANKDKGSDWSAEEVPP
jgi:homoserine acetyltransferase